MKCAGRSDAGFSTLEAVIAVGILALCILPLMDFQQTVSEGTAKLSTSNELISANEQAERYLRALPMERLADGQAMIGEFALAWQEISREEAKPALSDAGGAGRFNISLISLEYEVSRQGELLGRGEIERIVWTATSPFLSDEFSGAF